LGQIDMDKLIKDSEHKMKASIEHLHVELGKVRTGRASVSLVEDIKIDYYGNPSPLAQTATLGVPDSKTITIAPWDTSMLPLIEKAIQEAIVRAFHDDKKPVTTEHILGAIGDTKAISKIMGDTIDTIRTWARDKARYASSLAAKAAAPCNQKVTTKSGKVLDLNSDLENLDETVTTEKEQAHQVSNPNHSRSSDLLDD